MSNKLEIKGGYTRVDNEILDNIAKVNLSAYESRILWSIIRLTYGWNKKSARISLSLLSDVTDLPRKKVSSTLKKLEKRTIILINRDRRVSIIGIQHNYQLWQSQINIKYNYWSYIGQEKCPICGVKSKRKRLIKHHIYPKGWGGSNAKRNLIYICEKCHYKVHDWLDKHFDISPQQIYEKFYIDFLSPLFGGQNAKECTLNKGKSVPYRGEKVSPIQGTIKERKKIKKSSLHSREFIKKQKERKYWLQCQKCGMRYEPTNKTCPYCNKKISKAKFEKQKQLLLSQIKSMSK